MESVVSKIQETGQHTAKKTDALFARTRDAGEAFFDEVKGAGRDLVVFVRTEAKGWRRFLTHATSQLQGEAKAILSVPAVERRLLAQVDGALRTLDAKVRARLLSLEKGKRATRRAPPKRKTVARKTKSATPSARSAASANGVSVRH